MIIYMVIMYVCVFICIYNMYVYIYIYVCVRILYHILCIPMSYTVSHLHVSADAALCILYCTWMFSLGQHGLRYIDLGPRRSWQSLDHRSCPGG